MPVKPNFFKTALGKVVLMFLGLFAMAFIISKVGYYYMMNSDPEIIQNAFEEARTSNKVLSKTGKIVSYEYTYNEHDLDKDSLKFHITLVGENAEAAIDAIAVKDSRKAWKICKSDTVFSER